MVLIKETIRQSRNVMISLPEVPKKAVMEYKKKRRLIHARHIKKFFRISFMIYLSMIWVIGAMN